MFPGASEGPASEGDYAVVGAPLDISTSFYPGTRFGPDRIRHFAQGFEDYDHRTGKHFSTLGVIDRGDLRAWDDATEYLSFLAGELRDVVEAGAIPLLLGGEHTVTLAGLRATEPAVLVCLDAHLDLRESFDGNELSHATTLYHAREHVGEIIVLGARAGSEDEWTRARRDDSITIVTPEEIDSWAELSGEIGDRSTYLSVDIDVVDPGFAPATGTKEPGGIAPRTALDLVSEIGAQDLLGADIVEVNDRDDGQTPTLAAKLLRAIVYAHAIEQ